MKIRYFFVKDYVDTKKIRVEFRPTNVMLGNFSTKPMQGCLFQWQQDHIMGLDEDSKYCSGIKSIDVTELGPDKSYPNNDSSNSNQRSVLVADGSTPRTYCEVVNGKTWLLLQPWNGIVLAC